MPRCPDNNALTDFVLGASDEAATIAEHLDACDQCRLVVRALIKASRPPPAPAPTEPDQIAPSPIDRGTSIGRYMVVDLVGAGGMGVVYSAYDPQLDRKVAIKLLWAGGYGGAVEQSRLLEEAQALARVSHPNVIAVHDVGVFRGRIFVAMEFVHGETLGEWLRARSRPRGEVLARFTAAGQGLAAVHEAGVVHRDFKPDNVLIGADGRVRVTDFGLARVLETEPAAAGAEGAASPAREMAGTPGYMAPEQLLGRPADPRSDQFSFCVALFEALHGRLPFEGSDRAKLVRAERNVPRRLRRVVSRGLSFDPADRFPSMRAVVAALRQGRQAAWRRTVAVGAGLALVVLAVFGGRELALRHRLLCSGAADQLTGVWDARRRIAVSSALRATGVPYAKQAFASTARILDDYTSRWVAARTEACEATRLRGEQSEELLDRRMACLDARLGELRALGDVLVHADARMAENAVRSARSLGDLEACTGASVLAMPADPAQRAQVERLRQRLARAKALQDAAQVQAALRVGEEVVTAARTVGWRPLEADALVRLGAIQDAAGQYRAAEQTLKRAALAAEAGRHDTAIADARTTLAFVVGNRLARPAEGLALAEQAAAAIERLGHDQRREADLLHVMAAIYPRLGQWNKAVEVERRALAVREKLLGPFHLDVAAALNYLGIFLEKSGRFDEALVCHRRALAIREREVGREHPLVGGSLHNLGALYHQRGELDAALAAFDRSRRIQEKTLGPGHPAVAAALAGEGEVLLAKGRCHEALARDLRSAAIAERALGPSHPGVTSALTQAGEAHLACGEPARAVAVLERALAILEAAAGDPADLARARFALARTLWQLGRERARALALARAALKDYDRSGSDVVEDRDKVARWLAANRLR